MSDTVAEVEDQGDLIDADEMFRSLNGFEQIAVEQHFHMRLKVIADDELAVMRALLFVESKRDGMADGDAFRNVMLMRLDDVTARFRKPEPSVIEGDEDPSLQAERDREYAAFVVGVGVSFMPDQFNALTLGQRSALVDAASRSRG